MTLDTRTSVSNAEHAQMIGALDQLLSVKTREDLWEGELRAQFAKELAELRLDIEGIGVILQTHIKESEPGDERAEVDLECVAKLLEEVAAIRSAIQKV